MTRILLAAAAVACILSTPILAQSTDCDSKVQTAMSNIAKMQTSGAKRIALARMVATGYDYCLAGSMIDANKFFEMAASRER